MWKYKRNQRKWREDYLLAFFGKLLLINETETNPLKTVSSPLSAE